MATLPGKVVATFAEKQGTNWAVLLAWNALQAMLPILLLTIALLGFALGFAGVKQSALVQDLVSVMPSASARQETLDALKAVHAHSGVFFVFGLASFLWSGASLFSQMDQAFATIYNVKQRDLIPQKLMSFGMMLLFVLLVGVTLMTSSLLPLLKFVPYMPGLLTGGPATVALQALVGTAAGVILFGAIYFVVPNRRQHIKEVWPGALLAGVLFELLTLLFPVYLHFTGGGNTYGKTFGLFLLLLGYAYFLGLITVLGATLNAVTQERAARSGATEAVEHQPHAADVKEPPQPWRSLLVMLGLLFGALLAGKKKREAG
jgi:membrane protein